MSLRQIKGKYYGQKFVGRRTKLGEEKNQYWVVHYYENGKKQTKYFGSNKLGALRFQLEIVEKRKERDLERHNAKIAKIKAEIEKSFSKYYENPLSNSETKPR